MATITENQASGKFTLGKTSSRELVYDITGTTDDEEVEALILATAPATYRGLTLDSISAEPEGGNGLWRGKATYVEPEAAIDGSNEFTFDTGGGSNHITQGYGTVNAYAPAGFSAPDFQGAIGVSDDRVEGVDVPAPRFEFTETHYLDDAFVMAGYKLIIFALTGKVNDAEFRGLAAGECLFLGASGTKKGNEKWAITYRFSGSPNVTGLTVGDITGIDKEGWDYMWIRYAKYEDTGGNMIVPRPVAVYVERVSLRGDFSALGI